MALTAYCKKCGREVSPGEICPLCGAKLAKTAVHAAWVMEKVPVRDWMSWNAILRWLFPAGLTVLLLALALEGISGGLSAVEKLFQGSFPLTLGLMLSGILLIVFLFLLLQGKELTDYVIDSRGVHAVRYLPDPTPLKLLVRLKSPRLLDQMDPEAKTPLVRLGEWDLPWRAVARVQLWPEKCYILFYAPAWWLRIPMRCSPFSWDDALLFVREKLGKKKAVELPAHLRAQAAKQPARRKASTAGAAAPRAFSPAGPEPDRSGFGPVPRTEEIPGRSGSEEEPPEEADRPGSARYPQTEEEPAEAGSEQLRMDMDPDPEDQAP